MFDEPSSYLDVKQRLAAARMIRSLSKHNNYIIGKQRLNLAPPAAYCVHSIARLVRSTILTLRLVVEHDLSVLDYLSDYVCVLYGQPAVYGVVTLPHSVREGINIFLDGHIPTENLRFREESLTFRIAEASDQFDNDQTRAFSYPAMEKTQGDFHLRVEAGNFTDSE